MAVGKHGPTEVGLTLEDSPGGTARELKAFVRSGLEIGHNAETVETTGFGVAFRAHTPTGIKNHDDIDLTLIFDDTATTGSYAVVGTVDDGPQDDGREAVFTVADGRTYTVDVRLISFKTVLSLDSITMINCTLRPTGTGTWGT